MTGEGRIPAGDFRAIVDVAAARRTFRTDRPRQRRPRRLAGGANAAYAYGAYLPSVPGRHVRRRAAGAPRRRDGGPRAAVWLGRLQQSVRPNRRQRCGATSGARGRTRLPHAAGPTRSARRLTRRRLHGHGADGSAADGAVYYSSRIARRFPALIAAGQGGSPSRIAWRARGHPHLGPRRLGRLRSAARSPFDRALLRSVRRARLGGRPGPPADPARRAPRIPISRPTPRIVCTVQATGRRALGLLDFDPAAPAQLRAHCSMTRRRLHRAALVARRTSDRRRTAARGRLRTRC